MGHITPNVSLLILGLGWTGTYVSSLCIQQGVSSAGTTRDGRNGSVRFEFDPSSNDASPFTALPVAATILITFPLLSADAAHKITAFYTQTHPLVTPRWILLGSTGNFTPSHPTTDPWCDRHTPLSSLADRNKGESALLERFPQSATVLHLAGLFDATSRNPRNFISRIAATKDAVSQRKSVHYIHGIDVARAVLAVHANFQPGQHRWIITNLRVFDWWDFLLGAVPTGWDLEKQGPPPHWVWIGELMVETGVKALPRSVHELQKGITSREFWEVHGLLPIYSQL
ncbi:hypothetical protein HDU98_000550 [Podochytrium sp. JEL0797]|nr:hypothetical protein HDU98_000550 [Podochytrium sp. JEL0797]